MSYVRTILVALLAGSAGCVTLPKLDEPNRFVCKQDSDCIDGYGCVGGYCQKKGAPSVLGAPTGFSAQAGDGIVVLTWTNPTFADFNGVVIRRNTGTYPAGPNDGTLVYQGLGTSVTDSVANGSTLYYSIFAHDSQQNFSPSARVSATPTAAAFGVTGFTVTAYGRDVEVRWAGVTSGSSVVVRRDTSGYPSSATGTPVSVPSGANSTWDVGLTPGQTYYYSAFAFSGSNYSAPAQSQVALHYVLPPMRAPASWNEWVRPDGSRCDGSEPAGQAACFHAGEHRMFVVSARQCAGLTASDANGSFEWLCADRVGTNGSPEADFISVGFQPRRGLSSLVDPTSLTWFPNQVRVFDSTSTLVASSPSELWWDNPIETLNVATGALASGTVYVWNAAASIDLSISTSHVTILGGGTFVGGVAGTPNPVIGITGASFVWLENLFVQPAGAGKSGIAIVGARFPVIRDVFVQGADYGLALTSVSNGRFEHLDLSSFRSGGVSASDSPDNAFTDVGVANSYCVGIELIGSDRNWLRDVRSTGNLQCPSRPGAGLALVRSSDNVITNLLSSSNDGPGIYVLGDSMPAASNLVMTATAGNDAMPGLWITGQLARGNTVLNLAALNDEIHLDGGASQTTIGSAAASSLYIDNAPNDIFYSLFEVAGTNCTVTASTVNPGIATGCQKLPGTFASVLTNAVYDTSIVGMVTADNTNPSGTYAPYDTVKDWLHFDVPQRAFGRYGAPFPSTSDLGGCHPGDTCQVWDWRVSVNDGVTIGVAALREVLTSLAMPNWTQQVWSATDATTCAAITGAAWNGSSCATQVALKAIELTGPTGNGNGICEQNELCLATPNLGTYQGEGPLSLPQPGAGGGYSIVQYLQNGI